MTRFMSPPLTHMGCHKQTCGDQFVLTETLAVVWHRERNLPGDLFSLSLVHIGVMKKKQSHGFALG